MDEKNKVKNKDKDLSKNAKAHLKRYLQSQGIENPNMEVTEEGRKRAQALMRALKETHGN